MVLLSESEYVLVLTDIHLGDPVYQEKVSPLTASYIVVPVPKPEPGFQFHGFFFLLLFFPQMRGACLLC